MAMTVSSDRAFALTVSADYIIVRYELEVCYGTFSICLWTEYDYRNLARTVLQSIELNNRAMVPLSYDPMGESAR